VAVKYEDLTTSIKKTLLLALDFQEDAVLTISGNNHSNKNYKVVGY